jgi:hypothetical protein
LTLCIFLDTLNGVFLQVAPVPSFVEGSSTDDSESDRLQRMKTRIIQMERDMHGIHAMDAIIKKKGELAIDVERHALCELQKAAKSLNCKCMLPFVSFDYCANSSDFCIIAFASHSSEFIGRKQASARTCRCFDQSLAIQ